MAKVLFESTAVATEKIEQDGNENQDQKAEDEFVVWGGDSLTSTILPGSADPTPMNQSAENNTGGKQQKQSPGGIQQDLLAITATVDGASSSRASSDGTIITPNSQSESPHNPVRGSFDSFTKGTSNSRYAGRGGAANSDVELDPAESATTRGAGGNGRREADEGRGTALGNYRDQRPGVTKGTAAIMAIVLSLTAVAVALIVGFISRNWEVACTLGGALVAFATLVCGVIELYLRR
ncbi:hypothetical protein ABW19_dt0209532 [Dactylella cylindrospora]|nr:hypothetical protein ABW19_dt0209532 [Dactylella cylindrospora]